MCEEIKILCPKCKGRKTVPDRFFDVFATIITIGFYLGMPELESDRLNCPHCKGKGYIKL